MREAAYSIADGSFDMYEIMKALYEIGFDGPIRPDHGRMIWDEVAMPGYGLYDRALGATYLNGLWEAIEKVQNNKKWGYNKPFPKDQKSNYGSHFST